MWVGKVNQPCVASSHVRIKGKKEHFLLINTRFCYYFCWGYFVFSFYHLVSAKLVKLVSIYRVHTIVCSKFCTTALCKHLHTCCESFSVLGSYANILTFLHSSKYCMYRLYINFIIFTHNYIVSVQYRHIRMIVKIWIVQSAFDILLQCLNLVQTH